jgi:hypothetical protein
MSIRDSIKVRIYKAITLMFLLYGCALLNYGKKRNGNGNSSGKLVLMLN